MHGLMGGAGNGVRRGQGHRIWAPRGNPGDERRAYRHQAPPRQLPTRLASRSAAMGPVPAEVVVATFYNFHPRMVHRAIPDAWGFAPPEAVLAARLEGADAALRRLLGGWAEGPEAAEAAALGRRAMEGRDPAGRPLFAAHAALGWPEEPHLALWHAATLYREFRGDGHVACLLADGVDGCEAHVLAAGAGRRRSGRRLRPGSGPAGWSPGTAG